MSHLLHQLLNLRNQSFIFAQKDEMGEVLTKLLDVMLCVESRGFEDSDDLKDVIASLNSSVEKRKLAVTKSQDPLRSLTYGIIELMGPLFLGLFHRVHGVPSIDADSNANNQVTIVTARSVADNSYTVSRGTESTSDTLALFHPSSVKMEEDEEPFDPVFPVMEFPEMKDGPSGHQHRVHGMTPIRDFIGIDGQPIEFRILEAKEEEEEQEKVEEAMRNVGNADTNELFATKEERLTQSHSTKSAKKYMGPIISSIDIKRSKDGRFKCPDCSKLFLSTKAVATHYYVHDSTKCKEPGCGQNIKRSNWFKHMKNRHGINGPKQPRSNKSGFPMQCMIHPGCSTIFSHTGHVKDHMLSHSGARPHKCHYCDATFPAASSRFNHIKNVHNELPHPCDQCDEKFGLKAQLVAHKNVVHIS